LTSRRDDHKRRLSRLLAVLPVVAGLLVASPAASADDLFVPRAPASESVPPPGYRVSARDAIAIAQRNRKVRRELARPGPAAEGRAYALGGHYWLVRYFTGRHERVRMQLDGRSGSVSWVDVRREIDWPPIAHGHRSAAARRLHWAMLLAALLFVAPFVDPRRIGRVVHLDLMALVALGVPFAFAERGDVYTATPLIYPPILYLLGRAVFLALRGSPPEAGTMRVPARAMWALLGGVLLARYGYVLVDGVVNDVGYASLVGADSIIHGYQIYDAREASGHLDAYGPLAYLAYVPFVLVFPFRLLHDATLAAQVGGIVFDLGTIASLFAIGRRLRPGPDGTALGLILAWAFAACPWTLFALAYGTNDSLVALIMTLALLALVSPALRGAAVAAAAMTKFAPLIVGALMARTGRERGLRPLGIYAAAVVFTLVVILVPYLPDGGLRDFYDSTIGFQLARTSPFSIWGLHPSWEPLRPVVTALVAIAGAAALVLPRDRSLPRIAAAGAALVIGIQLTAIHWYWFYIPWFLPYLLVALFSRSYAGSVRNSGSSSESAVATNR
jgi:hypothetical protein